MGIRSLREMLIHADLPWRLWLPRSGRRRVCQWTLLLGSLLAAPAQGYVLETSDVGGKLLHPRWSTRSMPVTFALNDTPVGLLPNLAAASRPEAAISAAMRAWEIGPIRLSLNGATEAQDAGRDGVNLISFADTRRNRELVGHFLAWTSTWWARESGQLRIRETDTVFNPRVRFATDGGANARDLQDLMTHELGHALGLHHSPILAATMYPDGGHGQTLARSLSPDDIAGLRMLYAIQEPSEGAVAGQVIASDGAAVFGAHVVAVDIDGVARVGAITGKDGSFTISGLPPGAYQVFAEPLDGPMTPASLPSFYSTVRRSFRTAFAGGRSPAEVAVTAGKTTQLDALRVDGRPATINPQFLGWAPDGRSFRDSFSLPVQIRAGESAFLVVVGPGLDQVLDSDFSLSGRDVTLDTGFVGRGKTTAGLPFVILPLSASAGAVTGARSLYVTTLSERAALTGCLDVIGP